MYKITTKINLICITLICVIIFSCNSNVFYYKNKNFTDKTWNKNDIVKFNVPINDTLKKYDFYITLRNSSDYSFMNLFVFLKTLYPDGTASQDTIELILARPDGKWLGHGRNIIDNKILLKKSVQFKQVGIYSFEFIQSMRVDELKGIEDFGIQIEEAVK